MGEVIREGPATPAQPDTAEAGGSSFIARKARKLGRREAWNLADVRTVLSFVVWLLPSWLLPESLWAPIWRAVAHLPWPVSQNGVKRTGQIIRAALGDVDQNRAEEIARNLRAAVHELLLEDLRAWGPGGWRPKMVLEGEDHLRHALAGGKGAILW